MPEPVRILFVGDLCSSHAMNWIRLLESDAGQFQIQGVSLMGMPEEPSYPVRSGSPQSSSLFMRCVRRLLRVRYKAWADPIRAVYDYGPPEWQFRGLVAALRDFDPQIVHTFGFTPSALIYASLPDALRKGRRWVLQTRGGSDVAFTQVIPEWQALFRCILPQADIVLCDNLENYKIFDRLGIAYKKTPLLPFVPGAGGLRIADFEPVTPWAERENLIVWPKAYESPWSKALPVLEGLALAWDAIAPVRCVLTAADKEIENHIRLLPEHIQRRITVLTRIPHSEMLRLMRTARVMLAPSLVDGLPNSMLEAMAAGALPVVSPLPTIAPFAADGENVFYARNLYPEEISAALVRALTAPNAEDIVQANRARVKDIANRDAIAPKVLEVYIELAK